MKISNILIGVIVGFVMLLVVPAVSVGLSFIHYYDTGAQMVASIDKYNKASMNSKSTYTMKIKEAAKVPDMYIEDLRAVISDTFEGRYGADGSKATFQWIQENNIPVDPSLYSKLQTIIDAGRTEFQQSQDRKLEICATYKTMTTQLWSGFMLNLAGHNFERVSDMCRIVVDSGTQEQFKTGIDSVTEF